MRRTQKVEIEAITWQRRLGTSPFSPQQRKVRETAQKTGIEKGASRLALKTALADCGIHQFSCSLFSSSLVMLRRRGEGYTGREPLLVVAR